MEIIDITSVEYKNITGDNSFVFCREDFLELNRDKVDKVRYLLGKDKKNRIVVALGEQNGQWKAPYSAPFGTLIAIKNDTPIEYYWEFVKALKEYGKVNGINSINFFLPPNIYDSQNNAKIINALLGNGFRIEYTELNYHIRLLNLNLDEYVANIKYNARKNLNIALKADLEFIHANEIEEKKNAYEVIKTNRSSKGYPLRMSLKQVLDTIEIVKHDFFLIKKDGKSIAAAMVYYVTEKVVQVVYWGDMPDVGEYKSINYLAYNLIQYYKKQAIDYIDIGPSTENGLPNYGLCSFKESIGCEVSAKYRLVVDL